MKKNICSIFASILCSATLLLGIAGCDTGAGEDDPIKGYNPETPTTYTDLSAEISGTVNAKWDFSGLSRTQSATTTNGVWDLPYANTNTEIKDEMKQADGTSPSGAVLTASGLWVPNSDSVTGIGVLQAKKNTSTLTDLSSAGGILTLVLSDSANIVVKAKGAGAAEAARYIAITDESDNKLVVKDNLSNSKDVTFAVAGAPAGTYKIYNNGASFYSIDLTVPSSDITKPAEITKLVLYEGDEFAKDVSLEATIDTLQLTAKNVISESESEDITADAIWTSSNESVATVVAGKVTAISSGTTVIRARIGRFYDERTVTVTPCTKTLATFFKSKNNPEESLELGVDWSDNEEAEKAVEKMVKPDLVGDIAGISDETFAFSDTAKAMDWEGKESPVIAKAADATGEGTYKTGVIYWKNEQSKAWTDDQHFATLSFYATPKDEKVNLKSITFKTPTSNSNAKHYAVSVKVGDNEETPLKLCEKESIDIDVNNTISSRTKVEVKLYVLKKGSNLNSGSSGKAKSFGFNEILAVFSDISDK